MLVQRSVNVHRYCYKHMLPLYSACGFKVTQGVLNIYQDVGNVHVYVSYWHTGPRCCQSLRYIKLVNEFSSSGKKEAIWKKCRIGKVVGPLNSRTVWNERASLRGHSRGLHTHSHGLNYCRRKITALLRAGSWCCSCWRHTSDAKTVLSHTEQNLLTHLALAKYKGSILCILHE